MSLGAPSPPSPNQYGTPQQVATTQQGYNTGAQASSNYNAYNPYGSLQYVQTGTSANGTPIYSTVSKLSPAQQNLLSTLTGTQTTAGGQAQQLLTGANYGSVPAAQAIGNSTSGLTGQAVQQQVAYLQPYFGYQTQQLDTQLRNQGFDPSSPAYKQAMLNLSNQQNNTVTGFVSQIEPQMYQQSLQTYNEPAQLATSLAGFAAPNTSAFSSLNPGGAQLQPANYQGAVTQAQNISEQEYAQQLAQQQAMISGLFGIGSSVLGGIAKSGVSPLSITIPGSFV